MFPDHPLTPDIEHAVNGLPFEVGRRIRAVFADYANLMKHAERDRQAVLGFVDTLGGRLDDLPADPEYARVKAIVIAKIAMKGAP